MKTYQYLMLALMIVLVGLSVRGLYMLASLPDSNISTNHVHLFVIMAAVAAWIQYKRKLQGETP